MVMQNPIAAVANAAKTLTEQANVTVKGLSDGLTQATSQILTQAAQGLPGLPALGGQGTPARANGGPLAGLAQIVAPFTQLEEVILPKGLPRPSQLLLGTTAPARPPAAPARPPAAPANSAAAPVAPRTPARPRAVAERRGV